MSKTGDGHLRRLLVVGATSVTRRAGTMDTRTGARVRSLHDRKPARLVTVANANETARTAWALLATGESSKAAPTWLNGNDAAPGSAVTRFTGQT